MYNMIQENILQKPKKKPKNNGLWIHMGRKKSRIIFNPNLKERERNREEEEEFYKERKKQNI